MTGAAGAQRRPGPFFLDHKRVFMNGLLTERLGVTTLLTRNHPKRMNALYRAFDVLMSLMGSEHPISPELSARTKLAL